MIEKFEVGKYYRWIGPKKRQEGWNSEGLMDGILDGKKHLCIATTEYVNFVASFENTKRLNNDTWSWFEGKNFEIVPQQLEFEF